MGYAALVRSGRGVLGISQNAFAAMLGVHRTTLVRLEQGSPPLKHNLLEAAQSLLADLGVKLETALSQNELGEINISELQFTIPVDSLRRVQKLLDRGGSDDDFIRQLFGEQYVPPLKAKPLRRKIKR